MSVGPSCSQWRTWWASHHDAGRRSRGTRSRRRGRPGLPHPRGTGCFARYLGHHVRNGDWRLEEAVQKCSYHTARRFGLKDRGLLREGFAADVVVFDPEQIADRSTLDDGKVLAVGVDHVLVNGVPVLLNGERTCRAAGPGAEARMITNPPARLRRRRGCSGLAGLRAGCCRAGSGRCRRPGPRSRRRCGSCRTRRGAPTRAGRALHHCTGGGGGGWTFGDVATGGVQTEPCR